MNTTAMNHSVAIVAHFDPEDRFDTTFETLLDCLLKVCDQILVVSTCASASLAERFHNRVRCIFRPNVGYDFYSYKVGVQHIARRSKTGSLFLLNSSFLITDRQRFVATLKGMQAADNGMDMVSISHSKQMRYHLQSYLIYLTPSARRSAWFAEWVADIQPRNSKLEIIIHDEIGLSIKAHIGGAKISSWFECSSMEFCRGAFRWAKYLVQQKNALQLLNPRTLVRYNPVHFLGQALSQQCGLVKTELVRNNPCKQNLDWAFDPKQVPETINIQALANRSKDFYSHATSGLTVLTSKKGNTFPAFRPVTSGPIARPGVKIAVALHLFYPELITEIRRYLRNIIEPFDLFVTTPHEGAAHLIFDGFSDTAATIYIALSENRGRDIGPFLALQKNHLFNPYDAVLKIHGKRSKYSDAGDLWRQRIFKELLGCPSAAESAINLIRTHSCGIVGPHSDYLTNPQYWGSNRNTVMRILRPTLSKTNPEIDLGFFAGSMFWFKPSAIKQCSELIEAAELSFELENGKQDGTLAHAVERIFCNLATFNGLRPTSIKLNGAPMSSTNTIDHFTPVIKHQLHQTQ